MFKLCKAMFQCSCCPFLTISCKTYFEIMTFSVLDHFFSSEGVCAFTV